METGIAQQKITLAFINDKSSIVDTICNNFTYSGIELLFFSETIEKGLSQLATSTTLPEICVIDLDFCDKSVLKKLRKLKTQHPEIKLIAHSDIDTEDTVKDVLEIGFMGYLLIGSGTDDLKKAIETVFKGGKYFSMGVAETAQEYFSSKV